MGLATREAYGQAIAKLVLENEKVVVLDADLTKSTKTADAQKVCPERHFNMGIAEGNMIGTAAGFATSGYTVFASTFAMFATGRAWEQIRNSLAYPNLNVKVCGTHAGIAVGEDGVSHQATEDIAIMRAIPNMEVYSPCDGNETKAIIEYVSKTKTPCYVRLGRSAVDDVFTSEFKYDGKVKVLNQGKDVAIFTTGLMTQAALKAKDILKEEGIELTVVNVSSIKPLDINGVVEVLNNHKYILTAEEHNIIGGLGGAICEVASEYAPKKIKRLGMNDCYGQSGPFKQLLDIYGLDEKGVVKAVKELVK
ncbi:MAG: transketolase C-terminal domain-containing protein [Erysipelotrichaceae bacterium]